MKVFVWTFGCSANQADSQLMKTLIKRSRDYQLVDNLSEANVVIINSCTVKQNAETKFWKSIRICLEQGKKVIAAGCVPQADENAVRKLIGQDISIIGVRDVDKVLDALDTISKGGLFIARSSSMKSFHSIRISPESVIGIVPINEGCLGNCSYCKTKFARGNLLSYQPKLILKQIENLLSLDVKEIWITSQDTGAYGYDFCYNPKYLLLNLLKDILTFDKDFRIRIGMMNPNSAVGIIDELLYLMKRDKRIFKFLHIPIQSASDHVLADMNRRYDSKIIYQLFSKIRNFDEMLTLSTDVICGFPTENDADFEQTLKFISRFQPDIINISRFWPRPGTKAAELRPLYNQIPIRRARELGTLFNSYSLARQKRWLGWEGLALVDEVGKNNSVIARNDYYKQIVIKTPKNSNEFLNKLIGSFVQVEIKDATCVDLRANLV